MIRVCPKRDAVCPHGMACPYTIDEYTCRDERSSQPHPSGGGGGEGDMASREPSPTTCGGDDSSLRSDANGGER